MGKKKGIDLDLTINTNYVGNWGTWEAVREILQNGLDEQAADSAHKMDVTYNARNKILVVISRGITIARNTLLLGVTGKGAGGRIGQYGEGYKLAMLVLLRGGKSIEIVNGAEWWIPSIVKSAAFGAEVLRVRIVKGPKDNQDFVFSVAGVTPAEWKSIRKKCLALTGPHKKYLTDEGEVLIDEGHERSMFVGGLHICTLPNQDGHRWVHGFNFNPGEIRLDRDRRMVNEWEVEYKAAKMFSQVDDAPALAKLIEAGANDVKDLLDYGYADGEHVKGASALVLDSFVTNNGDDALPADDKSAAEEMRAMYRGAKIVVVGALVAKACRAAPGYQAILDRFERREIETPTTILKRWLEEHRDDLPVRLQDAFDDDLIGRSMDWRIA
jgi:hypothetical protein